MFRLITAIALVVLGAASVHAQEKSNFKLSAQMRLRTESDIETDYLGQRRYALMRFRPGFEWTADETASLFFQPQFSKAFGEMGYVATTTATTAQQTSGTTYDGGLNVHQAYVDYHPFEKTKLLAGRQVFDYGDALIVGALDWNNVGRSFDAFKVQQKYSSGKSDIFFSKLVDTDVTGPSDGDYDFYGLYNSFDMGENFKQADLYAFYLVDGRGTGANVLNLYTLGGRMKSDLGESNDYRAEVTGQYGFMNDAKFTGMQEDAEFGFKLDKDTKARLAVGGFMASTNYNQMFPTVHKWLGYADVLGRKNLLGGMVRYSFSPAKDWTYEFTVHDFFRKSTDASAFKLNGTTALGATAGSSSSHVGVELDAIAKYKATQSVAFSGGGGVMMPMKYLYEQFGYKKPVFLYADMEVGL